MITVNGSPADGEGLTVTALVARMDVPDRGVAVAVDAEVIPKSAWGTYVVPDGAHVEVVTAVQGG
jgi:sulfur carrier protein